MLLLLVYEDIDYERDCNYHRQSDITFGYLVIARGTRDVSIVEGSVQASTT